MKVSISKSWRIRFVLAPVNRRSWVQSLTSPAQNTSLSKLFSRRRAFRCGDTSLLDEQSGDLAFYGIRFFFLIQHLIIVAFSGQTPCITVTPQRCTAPSQMSPGASAHPPSPRCSHKWRCASQLSRSVTSNNAELGGAALFYSYSPSASQQLVNAIIYSVNTPLLRSG